VKDGVGTWIRNIILHRSKEAVSQPWETSLEEGRRVTWGHRTRESVWAGRKNPSYLGIRKTWNQKGRG